MMISTKGRYALRVMIDLAEQSAGQAAERYAENIDDNSDQTESLSFLYFFNIILTFLY